MSQTNEEPFALYKGKLIRRGKFWADVREMAGQLPDKPYVFNLCENRYLFCVLLLAAAGRGQICLLPPSRQIAVIAEIAGDYPGAYLASEHTPNVQDPAWFTVVAPDTEAVSSAIELDWEQAALIAFTSGSTGKPTPCRHNLATFKISAKMATVSLGLWQQQWLMISTTPPQHMYGLETSVFWPLFSKLILYDGRPFFPADICRIIETAPWPAVLVTTPTHLRSLIKANAVWTGLAGILSATDTLSETLAQKTQAILGQYPREIYGSTETLSFAGREPIHDNLWQPYTGICLTQNADGQTYLESPHLQTPTRLEDNFRVEKDGRFALLGRQNDMVKIGGKRTSLAELNRRLNDIEGVEDGFFCVLENGLNENRLIALVVSRLNKQTILAKLKPYIDDVFLPRKICFVATIPRNETGKLTKTDIEKLLATVM